MKVLIIESTQVNHGDDRGGVHEEAGSIVDVSKDNAKRLTEARRALYTVKADDPTRGAIYTATKEELDAAKALAKAKVADVKTETDPPQ